MIPTRRGLLREMFTLGWPVFVAQIAIMLHGVIDTVMAGRISAQDLATIGLGAAIYISVFMAVMGVQMAISPVVAQHFGAARFGEIGEDVRQCWWLTLFLSAIAVPLLLFPEPFIALAKPQAGTEEKLRAYLTTMAWVAPAGLALRVFTSYSTAVSLPRAAMALNLIGLACKVPLNLWLMYGGLGVPALGAVGCGVSSAIITWLLAGLAWGLVARGTPYKRFGVFTRFSRPDWAALWALVALGLPIGISIAIDVTAFTFMALFIARLGDTASGAHQIAANFTALLYMLPLSIAQATGVLVGQAVGARDLQRARATGWVGLHLTAALACGIALFVVLGRDWIAAFYSRDPAVMALASMLLWFVAAYHPFDAVQAVAANILRAYKITFAPMVIYAVALWGVGLSGGYVLGLTDLIVARMDVPGFWTAAAFGALLATAALIVYFEYVARRPSAVSPPRNLSGNPP